MVTMVKVRLLCESYGDSNVGEFVCRLVEVMCM
jgi:hypothetical protein